MTSLSLRLPFAAWFFAAAVSAQVPLLERTGPVPYVEAQAMCCADLDGDGDADLVVGGRSGLQLLKNDGYGAFVLASGSAFPPVPDSPTWVSVSDVDGDGDQDLFVSYFGQQNRLLENDGSGVFQDVTVAALPVSAEGTQSIQVFDADRDGDRDVFFCNSGDACRLLLNDGTGIFARAPSGATPATIASSQRARSGDVDGDGDFDLVIANRAFGAATSDWLWINDGSGRFTDQTSRWPNPGSDTWDVPLFDADGDGDLDVLQIGFRNPALYLNDGFGVFTPAAAGATPPGMLEADGAELLDVENDGDRDVWIRIRGTSAPQDLLWLNDGAGRFDVAVGALPPIDRLTVSGCVRDLDQDGDVDIVVGTTTSMQLLGNDGQGVFGRIGEPQVPVPFLRSRTLDIAGADVDGDGDVDILRAVGGFTGISESSDLLLNDGDGRFSRAPATRFPIDSDDGQAVELVDVDADGDVDAVLVKLDSVDRVLVNDGAGTFAVVPSVGFQPATSRSGVGLAVGDIDGDGDPDAIVANSRHADQSFRNDGSGRFALSASDLPAGVDLGNQIEFFDLDGDGDLDLIGSGSGLGSVVLINDGSGHFAVLAGALPGTFGGQSTFAVGDIDGDGLADLVGGERSRSGIQVVLGRGDGSFSVAPPSLLTFTGPVSGLALGDADEDGDLDLLVAPWVGASPALLINDGSGHFVEGVAGSIPTRTSLAFAPAWLDVDEDGDLDAYLGMSDDLLLSNLTRNLSNRAKARVGKPLTLQIRSAPESKWLLAASLGGGRYPVDSIGSLLIDPFQIQFATIGQCDAQGLGELVVDVPPHAGLIGAAVYWQAVLYPQDRLTGRLKTVVSGL